jgi:hypothetical protein
MSWQGHLQVAIEEDKDGYMRDSVWDQFRHPRIAVIAARGRDGKSIPADLAAAGPLEATVTVRPLDIPIEGATRSYWCFVQLIDHRGVVLVQSAPKKIRITAAATQPTNPR